MELWFFDSARPLLGSHHPQVNDANYQKEQGTTLPIVGSGQKHHFTQERRGMNSNWKRVGKVQEGDGM